MKSKFYITLVLLAMSLGVQAQWTATGGPYGGSIEDLDRDGSNNTYAIVAQNLYKSTDNGASWQKLVTVSPTSLYVNDLTIVNNKFYAVYYSSFYTSTDGLTWTRTATSFPFSNAHKVLKFGPDGFIAVYGNDGIFVSKDEGVTWVQALSDNVYYSGYERTVATTNGDLYTISRKSNLNNYQSFDLKKLPYPGLNGTFNPANWQTKFSITKTGTVTTSTLSPIVTGTGTSFTTELAVGSLLYTGGASPQYIGQVASITNNTTLTLNSNAGTTVSGSAFSINPYQYAAHLLSYGTNVYLVMNADILISQDAGTTWPSIKGNITAGNFWGFGTVNPSNGQFFYYNGGNSEIYSLVNPTPSSTTWTITPSTTFLNYGTNILCWAFISNSNILVGTNSAGVFKSTDTGATYSVSTTGITGGNYTDIVVANTTNKIVMTSGGNGYWGSTDSGNTWAFNSTGSYSPHALKLSNGNILLYGSKIFRSTDNGATFPAIDVTYYNQSKIVEAANGDLYGFSSGNINKSTDHGATWANLTITGLPASYTIYQGAVDGTNSSTPNFIFQIYDGNAGQYKVYKLVCTSPTAATATAVTSPYTNYLNNIFFQNSKFYVTQYSAYYYTADLGVTWTTVGFSGNVVFPISSGSYTGIAVSKNGSLYTSQDGGGSWNNTTLPAAYQNAYITDIDVDGSGNYFASAQGSPVLKYTAALLVDPTTLPAYINFNWQPLSGPYGGVINKIQTTPDGNTLFTVAGNAGSGNSDLWKYSSGSWSKITRPAGVNGSFDVEVDGSGNVYWLPLISPQKIYKSIDLGATWNPLTSTGLPASPNDIRRIKVLSDGSILAFGTTGTLGNIYKSSDGGATFTSRFTSAYSTVLGSGSTRIPGATAAGIVIIMGDLREGLLVSTDFGTTWTAKSTASVAGTTTGFVGSYMFDKNGNIILHAIVDTSQSPWTNQIVKSTDNGTTWTALPTPNIPIPNSTQTYSKRIITLGTGEYLMCVQSLFDCYRSTDGGATWTNVGNVGDVFVWSTTNGTSSYIMGSSNAGILKTTDGGQTFSTFSNGIPHPNSNDILFMNNNKDLIIGATRPYHSSDYGQTLALASLEPGSNYLQVGDSVIAYGNNRRLLKSKDYGKTWTEFGADNLYYSFLTQDKTGNGFYGSDGVNLFYSTDLKSWTNIVLSGLPASYLLDNMVIDQNGVIFAVVIDNNTNSADVYKIVFGSATKISTAIGTQNPYNILYFNNKIYLYDGNGAIYKSTDGETWTQAPAPAGTQLLASNGYLFVPGGNAVLWLSRNDGATWQSVGDTPASVSPFPIFNNVVINPFDGYAYATISNSVAKKSGNMVIPNDNTKPVVVTYSPTLNATGVGLKPTLSLTFDEVTNAVSGKLIRVFDLANLAVPIETMDMSTATQNGKTWSITTTATLSFNKTYFVIIDAGAVADIFGNGYLGISSNATWRFTTKNAPTPTSLSPANNAVGVVANSPFKISFAEPVTGLAGKNIILYAVSAPTTPVATLSATAGVPSGNDLTYTFPVSTIQYNTQYFIKADASAFTTADGGAFSAVTQNTDWTFTSRTAPTVATLSPANSSTGATLNTSLSVTLSEAFTLISSKNLNVYKASAPSTPVATIATTSGTISGNSLTVTLSSPLEFGTQYFVLIDANAFKATSDGGIFSAVTQNTTWTFTTRAAPTVATLSPANSSTGATLKPSLSISLSEAFTLVSGKNLNVYKASAPSTPVATIATTSGTISGNGLTMSLSSPLEFNTQYFVLIDGSAFKSVSDGGIFSAITQNTSWSFTTRVAPTVSTLSPANSATNVDAKATNTTLAITLSENFTFASGKKLYVTNTAAPSTPVFSIDLGGAVFSGAKATITLPGDLSYALTYAVTFDANAFTATSDGGNFGLLTTTGWQFTTAAAPDTQPPSIAHTQSNLAQGSGNGTISATVTDNVGVDTVKIYYRTITTNGAFSAVKLTGSNNVYSATVPEATYGPIGLEYYFTAKDGAGNLSRSPATGNYYSYISYTASTTSPLMPVSQLGIGGDVGNWRIITVPHKLGSANVATVFAVLGADDFSKWRLITYKDQTAWSQYPNDFTAFVQGTGYFINIKSLPTNSSSGIIIPGATTPKITKTEPFSFTLKPGWNQIGNPYTFPMEWNEVMAANNNPSGIGSTLKTFNGNYVDVGNGGKLGVFEGAFVLNSGTGSVTMNVPVVGKYAGGRIASSGQTPAVSHNLANETWTAPIALKIGAVENTFGGIGMNPDASVGVDRYDDFNPPRWVDFAEMSFAHPEHFLKASTKDVVPTRQDYTWAFDVATNVNGIAELTWDNTNFGSNSKQLFLVDLTRETLIDMRGQNSYSFDPKKSSSFKIYFGDNPQDQIKPLSISLGDAYPNPSNNTKVTIPFTLPESQSTYQVEMDIYNSMGQKVSTVVNGSFNTGFYSAQWEPNENLLSGMYIYRLKVAGKENSSVVSKKLIVNH